MGGRVQLGKAESLRQMARGLQGESSLHYENTTKHKTPAVSGTKRTANSHREAAACQQTPTNEWKELDSEASAAVWPRSGCTRRLIRAHLHYRAVTVSSCVIRGLDGFGD